MEYIAFLRAINVGGHLVKMEHLRSLFETLGFEQVQTFIASGNVIFTSNSKQTRATLQSQIETQLEQALGFETITFLRTKSEVVKIAQHQAFSASSIATAHNINVGFLREPLSPKALEILPSLRSEFDEFHSHGCELYWLMRQRQSDSKLTNAVFEKKLGIRVTFRGISTVQKIAAKYLA